MSPRRAAVERTAPGATVACTLAIVVLVLFVTLPGLGAVDLIGDDAILDAAFVREMVEGNWLFPEFNRERLLPKPPLFYWTAAAVSWLAGGVTEWTVRLPSVVFAVATAALTVLAGRRLVGLPGAAVGGAILTVMPIFHDQARIGRPDMMMTFFTTACLFLFALAPGRLPRGACWGFWALLGLATLVKGAAPVGLVATVVVVSALAVGRGRAALSLASPAVLAFLVIGGSWYALGAWHWGERFVTEHLIGENLRHFLGSAPSGDSPFSRYSPDVRHVVGIVTGTFPWALLLPVVWRRPVESVPGEHRRFLATWVLAGLVFFSLASRKSPYYLLPLYPGLALWVGAWLAKAVAPELPRWRQWLPGREVLPGIALATVLIPVWWWGLEAAGLPGAEAEALAGFVARHPVPLFGGLLLIVVLGSAAIVSLAGRRTARFAVNAWGTLLVLLLLLNGVEGALAHVQSMRSFAEEVRRVSEDGRPVRFYGDYAVTGVVYYSGRTIPVLREETRPDGSFYLIVPEGLELPERWQDAAVVARGEGRVFTRKRHTIRMFRIEGE